MENSEEKMKDNYIFVCKIIKKGRKCLYATKKGNCSVGGCLPVIAECAGCKYVISWNGNGYCSEYARPQVVWRSFIQGRCKELVRVEEI